MHCLLKWLETESSKQQCPMDRRPWGKLDARLGLISVTADRAPDKLPTTSDLEPVAMLVPGPIPPTGALLQAGHAEGAAAMEVDIRA